MVPSTGQPWLALSSPFSQRSALTLVPDCCSVAHASPSANPVHIHVPLHFPVTSTGAAGAEAYPKLTRATAMSSSQRIFLMSYPPLAAYGRLARRSTLSRMRQD